MLGRGYGEEHGCIGSSGPNKRRSDSGRESQSESVPHQFVTQGRHTEAFHPWDRAIKRVSGRREDELPAASQRWANIFEASDPHRSA